jgi:RHH-type transcriptional regulator, rel operon repressor / antitoxin RelB
VAAAAPKVQRSEVDKERLALQEWRVSAMKAAIVSLDRGEAIPHAAVRDWIESWRTDSELDPPKFSRA